MSYAREAFIGGLIQVLSDVIRHIAEKKEVSAVSLTKQYCLGSAILHPIAFAFFNHVDRFLPPVVPVTHDDGADVDNEIADHDAVPGSTAKGADGTQIARTAVTEGLHGLPRHVQTHPRNAAATSEVTTSSIVGAKNQLRRALGGMLCEQLVFAPVVNAVYVIASGLLHDTPLIPLLTKEVFAFSFLRLWLSNVTFWGPVSLSNFLLVPRGLRLTVSRIAAVLWGIWLIRRRNAGERS